MVNSYTAPHPARRWQPLAMIVSAGAFQRKGFGLTTFQAGLVSSILYRFAAAFMMFWGAHSDRAGERCWHTALPLLVIASGLVGVASP